MPDTLTAPPSEALPLDLLKVTPHPLWPWPVQSEAGLREALRRIGEERLRLAHTAREQAIAAADAERGDPFRHGFRLDHWHHADLLLGRSSDWDRPLPFLEKLVGKVVIPEDIRAQCRVESLLALLGGNRSAKSYYCARVVMDDLVKYPGTTIICFAETYQNSRETQQLYLWELLPKEFKKLNGKRDPKGVYYISYDLKGGFGLNQLILPNKSKVLFMTYEQSPQHIEGLPVGNKYHRTVAFWLDENAPLPFMEAAQRRASYHGGLALWSFTPVDGVTPAVREVMNEGCQTLVSLPAELLPRDRVHVAGCPPGHMPYIQRSTRPGAMVMYFHTILNPFGNLKGPFYLAVKERCQGKSAGIIMRLAYGYCADTILRAFPRFDAVHIIEESQLPERGTNYQLVDPHQSRPFFSLWWRVAPGDPPTHYVWADWPDADTFGEWAVPTEKRPSGESRRGWDGDKGPAQRPLGYGIVDYKRAFLAVETVRGSDPDQVADPQARALLRQAVDSMKSQGFTTDEITRHLALHPVRLPIEARLMDPRGGHAPSLEDVGGTTMPRMFAEEDRDPQSGAVIAPPMIFTDARGVKESMGLNLISELLRYDADRPLAPGFNAPRLYVTRRAAQVIWALNNFTGMGGEDGACKDPIDCLRYGALADLQYMNPTAKQYKKGGEKWRVQ